MDQTSKVSQLLHRVIFDAWDRDELSDAEMEEIAEMLGSRGYEQQVVSREVARKVEEDLKFERRMRLEREAVAR